MLQEFEKITSLCWRNLKKHKTMPGPRTGSTFFVHNKLKEWKPCVYTLYIHFEKIFGTSLRRKAIFGNLK
jgi:hypothetical protein